MPLKIVDIGKQMQEEREAEKRAKQQQEDERRKYDGERAALAESKRIEIEAEKKRAAKAAQTIKEMQDREYESDIMNVLRRPRDLNDRRFRANYWRCNSKFTSVVDKITGKDKKFYSLWERYSHAETEEEKRGIVEKMEKMYPTTKGRLKSAAKQEGRGR